MNSPEYRLGFLLRKRAGFWPALRQIKYRETLRGLLCYFPKPPRKLSYGLYAFFAISATISPTLVTCPT